MEGHKEHSLGVNSTSGLLNKASDKEDDVQSLDIFAAVREILQSVLSQSKKVGVHVNIKSTNSCQDSPRKSWFYIKVSTQSRVDITLLEDKTRKPALYSVLRYMQSFENESHLCIQYPSNSDGDSEGQCSVQQNVIVEGQRLSILDEVRRSKQTKDSTLHLRVYQPVWHMMKECTKVHSYLAQTRLFRPRVEMGFTMKVGEAVSQTSFRVQNKLKISQTLPSIVTDSLYYLQEEKQGMQNLAEGSTPLMLESGNPSPECVRKISPSQQAMECDLTAVSETAATSTVDPVLISAWCLNQQNEYRNISVQLSPIASYIPVEDGSPSIVTLTLFGPGYMPLAVTVTCNVLKGIDWSKYGLKLDGDDTANRDKGLLPCHASLVLKSHIGCFILPVFILLETLDTDDVALSYQVIEKNVESLLKEHRPELLGALQRTIDKVILPVLNNTKNRTLVKRSINSICKAVTEIVSLSSNEQFRASVLQCMKVADTVDLKAELNHQLTDISHKKHQGVWLRSTFQKVADTKDLKDVFRKSEYCVTDTTDQGFSGVENGCTEIGEPNLDERDNGAKSRDMPEVQSDVHYNNRNKTGAEKLNFASNHALKTCEIVYSLCDSKAQGDRDRDSDKHNDRSDNMRHEPKLSSPVTTPDISLITDDMDKVSPFYHLADDSPTAEMHITPDVFQITQGMKDVSPFQELACGDNIDSGSPQVISEDPCDGQIVPENLSSVEMPFDRYGPESNSQHASLNIQDSVMGNCDVSVLPTEACKKGYENNPVFLSFQDTTYHSSKILFDSHFKVPVSRSDFELLTSEDFCPTPEVVSNFE